MPSGLVARDSLCRRLKPAWVGYGDLIGTTEVVPLLIVLPKSRFFSGVRRVVPLLAVLPKRQFLGSLKAVAFKTTR